MKRILLTLAAASIASGFGAAGAQDDTSTIFKDLKPLFDARLRYEFVDQTGFDRNANAWTLRLRTGFETGTVGDTKLGFDVEWIEDLNNDFNSTTNGRAAFPVVADPADFEVNRLYLVNNSLPDTTITVGRQRIIMDDARFVGNVVWRQNEQTFDAVRVTNTSLAGIKLDGVYLNQVNRIFGPDSPIGRFNGDTFLFNASKDFAFGKLTGFAYLLDLEEAPANSTQTFGARFSGRRALAQDWALTYSASYAHQTDYKDNPLDFSASYYFLEGGANWKGFSAGIGYEVLDGDGVKGFSTPLATLYKFQGWADKFLATPADGVEDLYARAGYKFGDVGAFKNLRFMAIYHDFRAENISQKYGEEINLDLQAAVGPLNLMLRFADYRSDGFATDTTKFWFQVGYRY